MQECLTWYNYGICLLTAKCSVIVEFSTLTDNNSLLLVCMHQTAPLEYLSLYFDCPWLLVVNDFRQGLFIAAMFTFWITFVNEHHANRDTPSHLGVYWKQLAVVSLSSIFFFVYEFCERYI